MLPLFLVLWGASLAAQNTGWLNPSRDYGQFQEARHAYYDDGLYARADPDQTHIFYGYEFAIPATAEILGIEVRLDAWRRPAGEPFLAYLDVQLSWDGGKSWTQAYTAGPLASYELSYVLGGPADGWGRTWKAEEFGPETFRVRLFSRAPRRLEIRLDWVAVRVYYSTGLVLELDPPRVDLGSLTLADYDRGHVDRLSIQTLRITSSTTWIVYIAALAFSWRYTGDLPDPKKPCEHLLWQVEYAEGSVTPAEKDFVPLSLSERPVAKGAAGVAKLTLSFRLLVDYDTTWPGTYSLDFRYTLVSP